MDKIGSIKNDTRNNSNNGYVSPYGFSFTSREGLMKACQILSKLVSPEKHPYMYAPIPQYSNFTYRQCPPPQNCSRGQCNMSTSEQTSRGFTTPF